MASHKKTSGIPDGIYIRVFSYAETEFEGPEFLGIKITNGDLPFAAYIDVDNRFIHIGCQTMTIPQWRKISMRSNLVKENRITKAIYDAYSRIADAAEVIFQKVAKHTQAIETQKQAILEVLNVQSVAIAEAAKVEESN